MTKANEILRELSSNYIQNTPEKVLVTDVTVLLCHLTNAVHSAIDSATEIDPRVYVSTRAIKHLYDKKQAEEFDCIIRYAHRVIRYPDHIYKNKNPKRGDFCFIKTIANKSYFCSLELVETELFVVTVFRIRKMSYLDHYEHVWSWKDGNPSS